jgi:hypothetical protein
MGLDIYLMKTTVPEEEYIKNYLLCREKAQGAKFLEKCVNGVLDTKRDEYLGFIDDLGRKVDVPVDWKGYSLHELHDALFAVTFAVSKIARFLKNDTSSLSWDRNVDSWIQSLHDEDPEKAKAVIEYLSTISDETSGIVEFYDAAQNLANDFLGKWDWSSDDSSKTPYKIVKKVFDWVYNGKREVQEDAEEGEFADTNEGKKVQKAFAQWLKAELVVPDLCSAVMKAKDNFPRWMIADFLRYREARNARRERLYWEGKGDSRSDGWAPAFENYVLDRMRAEKEKNPNQHFKEYLYLNEEKWNRACVDEGIFRDGETCFNTYTRPRTMFCMFDYFMLGADDKCYDKFFVNCQRRVDALFVSLVAERFAAGMAERFWKEEDRIGTPENFCRNALWGTGQDWPKREALYWRKDFALVECLERVWTDSKLFYEVNRNPLYSESIHYPAGMYLSLKDGSFDRVKCFDVWENWENPYIGIEKPLTRKEAVARVYAKREKWEKARQWLLENTENNLVFVLSA